MRTILISLLLACAWQSGLAQANIIETICGTGYPTYGGDNGPATAAKIILPEQLCLTKNHDLLIVDAGNCRIRKINLSTGIITSIAGNGTAGYNGDGIAATAAALNIPESVATDTAGNIYIGDVNNYRIRKVTIATGIITTIAGNGSAGNSGDGGPATNASFREAAGMIVDKNGNVIFADGNNNNVRKIDTHGIITTLAGTGAAGYSGDWGAATGAQFHLPGDIAFDSNGNLYISDSYNNAIRKIDAGSGLLEPVCGNGTKSFSGDNGPAINATLNGPYGIFIDKQNNIFFCDGINGNIRRIDAVTKIITSVAGKGLQGYGGDGGPATDAYLQPDDVWLDDNGTMYIADYFNNRIRMVYNPRLATPNVNSATGEVKIYPNPAKEELTVEYTLPDKEDAEMQIVDVMGRIVISKELPFDKQKETVDISNLPQGVYVYKVVQDGVMIATGKVIKE